MQYLATTLGTQQLANTNLIFGIVFLAFVLLVPRGIVPSLRRLGAHAMVRRRA
jgi:branched-chain amino acid transport system permease protein